MKTKGKKAWLITWEGSEAEDNGKCKVVAVLPAGLKKKGIKPILRVLYSSEYNFTLCEKAGFSVGSKKDPFFTQVYTHKNAQYEYGCDSKEFLCARKVRTLRCEESKVDAYECTLYWTELPKYIFNPEIDPNGPLPDNQADWVKQVIGEREAQYTYSSHANAVAKQQAARRKEGG
jgi:hypothetical protein